MDGGNAAAGRVAEPLALLYAFIAGGLPYNTGGQTWRASDG